MIKMLKKLHLLAYLGSVFFCFCLIFPILYFIAKSPTKHYVTIVSFRRFMCVMSARIVGIRIEIEYEQPIDWSRNYVVCPNHTSLLDIAIITYLCKSPFSFIGKEELLMNPVTRIFFKTIDIPVKRHSKISSFKAYKRATALLQDGKSVTVFPEGKIDDCYPPKLHSFKSGAFKMATENKIPILPVIIQDAWKIIWDDGKTYGSKPGTIHVKILPPIETKHCDHENHASLEALVYDKMKDAWDIYNKS